MNKLRQTLNEAAMAYIKRFMDIMDYTDYTSDTYNVGDDPLDVLCVSEDYFYNFYDIVEIVDFYLKVTKGKRINKRMEIQNWIKKEVEDWYDKSLEWCHIKLFHPEIINGFMNIKSWLNGAPRQIYLADLEKYQRKEEDND